MSNIRITLSGADERTKVEDLVRLSWMGAEIGLLCTFSPDGRNRYPTRHWIANAAYELNGRAALHVCGGRARAMLVAGELHKILSYAGRVQVNGRITPAELASLCNSLPMHTIITQHDKFSACSQEVLLIKIQNHAVLVDGSGGRGLSPSAWVRPVTDKHVGFAGGLGPDNLAGELPKIVAAAGANPTWVDAEGRLRDSEDFFSVEKAMRMVDIWKAFAAEGA